MRRVVSTLVVLALTACAAHVETNTTTAIGVSPTTLAWPDTTSTTVQPNIQPLGLITPTGVPVAIQRELSGGGFLVFSPCGNDAIVFDGELIFGTTVVIDPGHGGARDIGAQGRNGLPEKVANLRVADALQDELQRRGVDSALTRTDDYNTTLVMRANLADALGADLMVSIHHNAPTPPPSDIPGVEVYVQNDSEESRRLGGLLWEHTVAALSEFDIQWTAAPDSGVMTVLNSSGNDAYGIVRRPSTPTALLELGHLSHPPEAELFATDEYLEAASRSIADAIQAFLHTDNPGAGFVEPGRIFNPNPGMTQDRCEDPLLIHPS